MNDFKQWVHNEFNKRLTKKGKLFEFTMTFNSSLFYGKTHVLFSNETEKMKMLNSEVLDFIEKFIEENKLDLGESKTGGTATCFTILRKQKRPNQRSFFKSKYVFI